MDMGLGGLQELVMDREAWHAAVHDKGEKHNKASLSITKGRISCVFPHTYREGNGTPLQYSCLENPMDGGAWWATVHGVAKSGTRLSDFTFTFHFHALEKEMATDSNVLA